MAIDKIARRIRTEGAQAVLDNGPMISGTLPPLMSDLNNIRTRIANFGRGQVNEELKRQER